MSAETTGIDYFSDDIVLDGETAPATMERLIDLAAHARRLTSEINAEAIITAEKSDKLKNILRNLIPNVMDELGMEKFKLTDGSELAIRESLNASITEENKAAAFKWLEDNEFDGIIKTKVQSEFGKGEAEEARRARDALIAAGFLALLDRSVHPMTLKSFVKERLENGDSIPIDVFSIHQFKEAKITAPKAPKKR